MKQLVAIMVAIVVAVAAEKASADSPPPLELFNINRMDAAQEARLVRHVEEQAKIIFGEHFLRVEVLSLGLQRTFTAHARRPGKGPVEGTLEIVEPTKVIAIFYKPLPYPRNPVPMEEIRHRISQPFAWTDGREARLNLQGKQQSMTPKELEDIERASGSGAEESKVGLVPGVIELRPSARHRSI